MARMTDVLPVPGAPHNKTGTRAEIATLSASTTTDCSLIRLTASSPVQCDPGQCGWPEEFGAAAGGACQAWLVPKPFDAELYLRLEGERAVLGPVPQRQMRWEAGLAGLGAALVAIDALPAEIAQSIVDDYQIALSVRGAGSAVRGRRRPPSAVAPVVLTAPRVVLCERVLDQPWGRLHVHYVALGDRSMSMAISVVESAPGSLMSSNPVAAGYAFGQAPMTDDQGTTEVAQFSGGAGGQGGGALARGQLTTQGPLSRATQWIEIGSGRLDLSGYDREPPAVRIETLAEPNRAVRYLQLRLATSNHNPMVADSDGIEASIQAFLAARALDADDPVIADARAIAQTFGTVGLAGLGRVPGQGPPLLGQAPPGPGSASQALPPKWASLFARRAGARGPGGAAAVGIVTPPIDGVIISMEGLLTNEQGWEIHVATSPGIGIGPPGMQRIVDQSPIAWWAEDDRGNHYLGHTGSWGGNHQYSHGAINYWPPLDPRATELRLTPTGSSERAVITLDSLPWSRRP
jgi:hypothetical protein